MDAEMRAAAADIAKRHRLEVKIEQIWYFPPSPFAKELVESVRRGAEQAGYAAHGHRERRRPRRLLRQPRGADGHDLRAVQGRHQPQRDRGRQQGRHRRRLPRSSCRRWSREPIREVGTGLDRHRGAGRDGGGRRRHLAHRAGGGRMPSAPRRRRQARGCPASASPRRSRALFLSVRYRMPIITAWSTPGAALIASTSGVPGIRAAVGAFVLAAVLILLTAAIRPLGRLIEQHSGQHRRGHAGRHPAAPGRGDGRACADARRCWCCR